MTSAPPSLGCQPLGELLRLGGVPRILRDATARHVHVDAPIVLVDPTATSREAWILLEFAGEVVVVHDADIVEPIGHRFEDQHVVVEQLGVVGSPRLPAESLLADAAPAAGSGPVDASQADFPRQVEHALGVAEIPAPPMRVVALDMSFVDASLALGVPLFGYTLFQDPDGELPDYFGEALELYAADAVYLGDLPEPNLEAIAAAKPDLILSSKVRHEAIYEQLSAIAPTVMSESAGAGWKDNIRLTAEAVGRDDVAAVLSDYEARAASVGSDINTSWDDPVVSVARFLGLDQFRLYQRASFSGVVLDDAGLARPENQQATDPANFITEVSFEQLAEADNGADRLFYTIFGNENPDDEQANAGRSAIE